MSWKKKLYNISIIVIALFLFANCNNPQKKQTSRVTTLPYYNDAVFTPHWLDTDNKKLDSFHKISSFHLTNQDGDIITEKTFENKIYIADFFFTSCPGICSKMTANMAELQNEFLTDDDVLLLSHSVTPEIDSIAVLKEYAETKGVISGKWHLVTGSRQLIYSLGRKAYFVEEDLGIKKTDNDFLHTENFVLIDKNKHIRGIYNGLNKASMEQLIADVKTLKLEN